MTLEEEIMCNFRFLNKRNREEVARATKYIRLGQSNAQANTTTTEQDLDAMAEERWQEYCKQQEREKKLHQQQYM